MITCRSVLDGISKLHIDQRRHLMTSKIDNLMNDVTCIRINSGASRCDADCLSAVTAVRQRRGQDAPGCTGHAGDLHLPAWTWNRRRWDFADRLLYGGLQVAGHRAALSRYKSIILS